jgi:hypothetical protein
MKFRISPLSPPENGIWRLYKNRNRIFTDPPYQRFGDIWTKGKKQLLIDTILNGFDVPKIYFHRFPKGKEVAGNTYDYAIIDGKQRLEAVWDFIDGKFALDEAFEYYHDQSIEAGGLKYSDLAKHYPDLKTDFDSFTISVVGVECDDDEIIEDLFSRLNEAVPLSAAEKRNAFGGAGPKIIRELALNEFFTTNIPFSNSRYRHFNLAVTFLIISYHQEVVDTKKAYLDQFVRDHKDDKNLGRLQQAHERSSEVLDLMAKVFDRADPLLRQVGMVVLYFHTFRIAQSEGWLDQIERRKFVAFEEQRKENRRIAEEEIGAAEYELLEFDRYAQSPNDAYAVKLRLATMLKYIFGIKKTVEDL